MGLKKSIHNFLGRAAYNVEARGKKRVGQRSFQRPHQKAYAAAAYDRLSKDWKFSDSTADVELHKALRIMRNRSRDLARNDDYFKRFLNLLKTNVIGHEGVRLQANYKTAKGEFDEHAIEEVERAWKTWSKKKTASVCETMSLWQIACQVIRNWAIDGEALIQLTPGWDNSFGFSLKVLSADQLDLDKNGTLSNGNTIRMGVEKTSYGKPVAYHLLTRRPGDTMNAHVGHDTVVVPANQIIHFFLKEDAGQTRGEPLVVTAMKRLRQLGAYEEAELVASRIGASKMGFYKTNDGAEFGEDLVDEDGNPIEKSKDFTTTAEPGTFEVLPDGYDFVPWDPQHPNSSFGDFAKSVLRGVASGLNVSYVGLSNNLEGVSYSSIRSGEMADRDAWRMIQRLVIENFYEDVFSAWMPLAIASGKVKLPMADKEKWKSVNWRARGWTWVDPDKEVKSKERSVANSFESLYDVAAERGFDLEEIFAANGRAKASAEKYGLKLPVFEGVKPEPQQPKKPAGEQEES